MNKTIKLVLFLAVVSCVSGLSIGIVNSFTEPVINKNAINAEKSNLEVIFPGGDFNIIEYQDDSDTILGVYEVVGKGYIVKATGKGYNSSNPIIVLIGLDTDGTIVNIAPLQQAETSGIGSKLFETDNINKLYVGKTLDSSIDGISGASFTSNAMKTMIQKAFEVYKKVK